ncbi:hypothetical protein [Micromonospora maritima]|uniref:hypothetical protein n=1 Tax=Micromonospora maritima TaxID=986711 RepID=UPI00157BEA5A|nr:hypothetical protein [Micromonospora maritima]
MSDPRPYVVDLTRPAGDGSDERWRIEFRTTGHLHWIDDVPVDLAQAVYGLWLARNPGRLTACRECPSGTPVDCPHEELPEQRGWRYVEINDMRIMPMREAL